MSTTEREASSADIRHYIRLAVCSDDPADFLSAVVATLDRPIVVLDSEDNPLAWASSCPVSAEMLAVARRARRLGSADADGWRAFTLQNGEECHGILLVEAETALHAADERLLEVVRGLLADQLQRARLTRLLAHERAAALGRRLAGGAAIEPESLHGEALRVGVRLADFYRAALVLSDRGGIDEEMLIGINDVLCGYASASFAVPYSSQALVLLVAQQQAGLSGSDVQEAAEAVLSLTRHGGAGSDTRIIVAEHSVGLRDISAQVRSLWELRLYPVLRDPAQSGVISAGNFALVQMLEQFDDRRAREFVTTRLGPLLAHDQANGAGLADTLEAALDWPSREEASKFAYMHRNTFRRRLKRAHDLIGSELSDPDERLAVHLALKLRRILAAKATPGPSAGWASARDGAVATYAGRSKSAR